MQVIYLTMINLKIFQNKIDLIIILNAVFLILILWLANATNIDITVENNFFDFDKKLWLIDRDEPIKKFIFYNFPKYIFGAAIFLSIIFAVLGFKKKTQFFFNNRHKFLLAFLGLTLIPLIAGNIKKFTNIYCPSQLEIYDGDHAYVKIFQPNKVLENNVKKGKCFPAGHAVTGFAWIILFFVFEKKSRKYLSLAGSMALGWVLGFYQMMKGAHFVSDTFCAMLICFILAAVITRIYKLKFRQ